MPFYVNTTRHPAIVTLKISGPDDLKVVLQTGANNVFDEIIASTGYWDVQVRAGEKLDMVGQPDVVLIAVRSTP